MLKKLCRHGRYYWLKAFALFLTISVLSPILFEYFEVDAAKNFLFLNLTRTATNPDSPRSVRLVLIEDDEFWLGPLQHRIPTNRDYLGQLVTKIAAANPRLIALDFDMRLPSGKPGEHINLNQFDPADSAYKIETDHLIAAIANAAKNHSVVLAKSIDGATNHPPFDVLPDAYMPYGICSRLNSRNEWSNPGAESLGLTAEQAHDHLSCGYLALMPDRRQVAPPVKLNGEPGLLDSFPVAIARALDELPLSYLTQGKWYASYLSGVNPGDPHLKIKDKIPCVLNQIAFSARCVLNDEHFATEKLYDKAVIIGVDYHNLGYGIGQRADLHSSPIQSINGAQLHANIAEALISGRVFRSPSEWGMFGVEQVLGVLAIFCLAAARTKLGVLGVTAGLIVSAFLIQWECLLHLALFVDMYLPVIGVALHAFIDLMWHEKEHKEHGNHSQSAPVNSVSEKFH